MEQQQHADDDIEAEYTSIIEKEQSRPSTFEITKALGMRAYAISYGELANVPIPASGCVYDAIEIAKMELAAGKLPVVIVRRMPDGTVRLIDPNNSIDKKQ